MRKTKESLDIILLFIIYFASKTSAKIPAANGAEAKKRKLI